MPAGVELEFAYANRLLSSISPLITLDSQLKVRFANPPFLKEFSLTTAKTRGKPLLQILKINRSDSLTLEHNLKIAGKKTVQNSEFKIKGRIYGYTVFKFGEDIGLILKDITDIKRLEKEIQRLHSRLLHLQESERQKIASELHDGVGQTILAAKINFIAFKNSPEKFEPQFEEGLHLIDIASQELRDIYTNLYPSTLKELGLEAAIRSFARNFLEVNSCKTFLQIKLRKKLSAEVELNIFRIVQEVFTNIVKHAEASEVSLVLISDSSRVDLQIGDNGHGFALPVSLSGGGFGLVNIRRRVDDLSGYLDILTEPEEGTTIHIRIPTTQKSEKTSTDKRKVR